MIAVMILGASACDVGILVNSASETCVKVSDTQETCTATTDFLMSVPQPGSKICLDIRSKDNATALAHIEVTYVSYQKYLQELFQYYTCSYTVQTQSVHRCWTGGNCYDSMCEDMQWTERLGYGELSLDYLSNWPGRSRCDRACGCAGCGCFYCVDGCIFSGYAIVPQNPCYMVNKVVGWQGSPVFNVSINGLDDSATYTGELNSIPEQITKYFELSYRGALTGDTYVDYLPAPYVILNLANQNAFSAPCSAQNQPLANTIGDIQSNSYPLPTGIQGFKYDQNIIYSTSASQDRFLYFATSPGANLVTQTPGDAFPITYNGYNWKSDSTGRWSYVSDPGEAVLYGTGVGEFSYTKHVTTACPRGEIINVTGCYNCIVGCSAVLSLSSPCGEGLVILNSSTVSLKTNGLSILSASQIYVVYFTTTRAATNFSVCLCNAACSCFSKSFTADYVQVIGNNSDGQVNDTVGKDSGSNKFLEFFDDVFKGVGAWWQTLVVVVVIVAILALAVLIAVPVIKRVLAHRALKKVAEKAALLVKPVPPAKDD